MLSKYSYGLLLQATVPTNVGGTLKDAKKAEEAKKESTDAPSTLQIVGDNAAGNFSFWHNLLCVSCGSKLVPS